MTDDIRPRIDAACSEMQELHDQLRDLYPKGYRFGIAMGVLMKGVLELKSASRYVSEAIAEGETKA